MRNMLVRIAYLCRGISRIIVKPLRSLFNTIVVTNKRCLKICLGRKHLSFLSNEGNGNGQNSINYLEEHSVYM